MGVRRTLESAVRREVGVQAGGSRAIGQWARRALPLTVSEQGEAARGGLPAVLLQASGERGPRPRAAVSENRLDAFGRATLRAITALDARVARSDDGGPFADEPAGIVTVKRLLPDWAIRLLVGTLLLPPLLTAVDGFFGARRRRLPVARWLGWVGRGRGAVRARVAVDPPAGADGRARRAARPGAPGRAAAARLEHRRAALRPARAGARVGRRAAPARRRARPARERLGRRRGGRARARDLRPGGARVGRQPVRGGAAGARGARLAVRRRARDRRRRAGRGSRSCCSASRCRC